jgi:putative membrane protein
LNAVVRPILVILTLPVTILTLGLFLFVLNALLFWLVAELVPGFEVRGFLAALIGSVLYSVITLVTGMVLGGRK